MAAPNERTSAFGPELRRWRLAANLSLADLGRKIHYDRSNLSRIENGLRRPGPDLVRVIDRELGARGALMRLVEPGADDGLNDNTVVEWPGPVPGLPGTDPVGRDVSPDADARLDSEAAGLGHLRAFGQIGSPAGLQAIARERSELLEWTATGLSGRHRSRALVLAARYVEFAGWMAQEVDDTAAAIGLTRRAALLARAAGDPVLGAYTMVRRALISLYANRPGEVIDLARRARRKTADDRVCGLAAQREAQGHALRGDELACRRALDEAEDLLSRTAGDGDTGGTPPLGSSHGTDNGLVIRGWCLFELGDPAGAAAALIKGLGHVPDRAGRARARLGARLALSLVGAGEVDEACAVAEPVVLMAPLVDSATMRTDLRRLNAGLRRWHTRPAVRRIWPALTAATNQAAPNRPADSQTPH